jgi:prolyl 4-hydroxylase
MMDDVDSYVFNPLNAFSLIKRLTNDSMLISQKMFSSIDNYAKLSIEQTLPREELSGSVDAIFRLQNTYSLRTEDLVKGIIDGKQYNTVLSAHDLFTIGVELFQSQRSKRSIEFLNAALDKARNGDVEEVKEIEILEQLVEAQVDAGNNYEALKNIEKILKLDTEDSEYFITMSNQLKSIKKDLTINQVKTVEKMLKEDSESELTRKVCSGELKTDISKVSKLSCRFISNSAFSKLARFKLEEAFLDPYIVVYHEVLSDSEIDILKKLANPHLERSEIFGADTLSSNHSSDRISKINWIDDKEHEVVKRISDRVGDMTGLSLVSAEQLQPQQYGLAGFYDAHYDFGDKAAMLEDECFTTYGNRIATVLFYVRKIIYWGMIFKN